MKNFLWLIFCVAMVCTGSAGKGFADDKNMVSGDGLKQPGFKITDNESPRPQDRLNLPKKDSNQQTKQCKTQPGNQGAIFDRWGNQ